MEEALFDTQEYTLLKKLFSFIASKNGNLNATLGGYFNKVVSYWLLKQP